MTEPNKNSALVEPAQTSLWRREELDLLDIFYFLWKHKLKISGLACAALVSTYLVAKAVLHDTYRSSVLLAPAVSDGANMGGMLQSYSGLASLAGVDLSLGQGATKTRLALAVLQSQDFIAGFIEKHQLLAPLFAAKNWNPQTGELTYKESMYLPDQQEWVRKVSAPLSAKPSEGEAYEKFLEGLSISEENETGFVTIRFEHASPLLARQWLNLLVSDLNQSIRQRDILESQRSIEYLREQVENTPVADLQVVFYDLIQAQTETIMLAQTRPEYVFRVIDSAKQPELPHGPNRLLIALVFGILGGFIGLAWGLLVEFTGRAKRAAA